MFAFGSVQFVGAERNRKVFQAGQWGDGDIRIRCQSSEAYPRDKHMEKLAMCTIRTFIDASNQQRRIVSGRFEVKPDASGPPLRTFALVCCPDGETWLDQADLENSPGRAISHHVNLEIQDGRLTAFSFGFDFTDADGEQVAESLLGGLERQIPKLNGVFSGNTGEIRFLRALLQLLWPKLAEKNTIEFIRDRIRAGKPFPELPHGDVSALVACCEHHLRHLAEAG